MAIISKHPRRYSNPIEINRRSSTQFDGGDATEEAADCPETTGEEADTQDTKWRR